MLLQAFRHILRHISRLGMKNGIGKTQIQGKLKLTQINTADHGPGTEKSIFSNTRKFGLVFKTLTVGQKIVWEFWILVKRERNINNSNLIYPSVSLLQSGDISNDKGGLKLYLGCEKSLMVNHLPSSACKKVDRYIDPTFSILALWST